MSSKIDKMFNQIISESTKEVQEELGLTKKALEQSLNENGVLRQENHELKTTLKKYKLVSEVEALFIEDNFIKMLPLFKLKSNGFPMGGMDFERVPVWFRCLYAHYEDREKLFDLMDLFNIRYPQWAKNFKMPNYYSEEELQMFVEYIGRRYVCNSCIFEGNTGFFWNTVSAYRGNTLELLKTRESANIPWQLVLFNPLWVTDTLFDVILNTIRCRSSDNSNYFFAIQEYNTLTEDQIRELIKLLPVSRLWDVHKKFITRNLKLVKETSYLVDNFKDKIQDNRYSLTHYLNYPVEVQKEFIRKHTGYESKYNLIKNMEIPEEEKIKFSMEFVGDRF